MFASFNIQLHVNYCARVTVYHETLIDYVCFNMNGRVVSVRSMSVDIPDHESIIMNILNN